MRIQSTATLLVAAGLSLEGLALAGQPLEAATGGRVPAVITASAAAAPGDRFVAFTVDFGDGSSASAPLALGALPVDGELSLEIQHHYARPQLYRATIAFHAESGAVMRLIQTISGAGWSLEGGAAELADTGETEAQIADISNGSTCTSGVAPPPIVTGSAVGYGCTKPLATAAAVANLGNASCVGAADPKCTGTCNSGRCAKQATQLGGSIACAPYFLSGCNHGKGYVCQVNGDFRCGCGCVLATK